MKLQLNPNLDSNRFASDFAIKGRVRIDNVLETDSAEAITDCLNNSTAWQLSYSGPNHEAMRVSSQNLARMTADDVTTIATEVHKRGGNSYQYIHKSFPILELISSGKITVKSLHYDIASLLNSTEFIKFARLVTGNNNLVKVDPKANLYEPSHFRNLHNDTNAIQRTRDNSIPRFAIVLGFTKMWSVNWGGEMSFFPGPNPISAETSYPGYNTLEIFKIETPHRVSMIMPFAAKGRYTITGWLREDGSIIRQDLVNQTNVTENL